MQIIKPPLGIKDPLVGARVSLPLLRKNLNPQSFLGRFIKPLGAIQGKGLSRFSPLGRRSELWPTPTLESSMAWDTAFPTIDPEPAHIERWGDGEIKNFPSPPAESPLQKQAKSKKPKKQAETKSRSKSSSKKVLPPAPVEGNHPSVAQTSTGIKDKSSLPKSLKDSGQRADAAYESAVPSFEDSISVPDRDSYTTAAATIDTIPHSRTGDVSQSNEKRYNLASPSNQSPQAAPLLAQSIPGEFRENINTLNELTVPVTGNSPTVLKSLADDIQPIIPPSITTAPKSQTLAGDEPVETLRPSDGNTFSAEPPLPIPGDKATLLGSVTANSQPVIPEFKQPTDSAYEPAIPNFEDLGQSDRMLSTPQTIISIPNRDLHLTASPDINTIAHSTTQSVSYSRENRYNSASPGAQSPQPTPSRAESTPGELSENITTLSELTVPVTANSPTVINSLADDIQPIISPSVTTAPDSQTLAGDEPVETLRRSDGNTFSQHEVAQTGELTHEASTLPEPPLPIPGDSPTCESLPPPQGFAVGGQVTAVNTPGSQQIAPSDTVPAMLTPGEFVINTRDAQKNLALLQHINTGGTVTADQIPVTATPASEAQRQSSDIGLPMVLEPEMGSHPLTPSPPLPLNRAIATEHNLVLGKVSTNYSSPPLIFRQPNPAPPSPTQWSSVEDLLNENTEDFDEFAQLNFGATKSPNRNSENSSASLKVITNRLPQPRGFAAGGEVTTPNTVTPAQPVTKTIAKPSSPTDADSPDLEALAREIYSRLRQRLEVERERHGIYSGRLPW